MTKKLFLLVLAGASLFSTTSYARFEERGRFRYLQKTPALGADEAVEDEESGLVMSEE